MKSAQRRGARLSALVNVEGSSLYRLVDDPILLSAGPERCVLATKSFTAKLGVLLMAAYAAHVVLLSTLDESCSNRQRTRSRGCWPTGASSRFARWRDASRAPTTCT